MITLINRSPWSFAVLYTAVSLTVEAILIVVARLKVPEDNALIAPVVLTVPPMLAAAFSGFRHPLRDLLTVAALASILTLLITVVVTRVTGVSTGLAEPILNRSIAGWLGALITNRVSRRPGVCPDRT
jgi:hypothetical protein